MMRTTPFGSFRMTGRIGVQFNEKEGRSGLDHLSTFEYAALISVRDAAISRLNTDEKSVRGVTTS